MVYSVFLYHSRYTCYEVIICGAVDGIFHARRRILTSFAELGFNHLWNMLGMYMI